jgi:hypothetical protein
LFSRSYPVNEVLIAPSLPLRVFWPVLFIIILPFVLKACLPLRAVFYRSRLVFAKSTISVPLPSSTALIR